MTRQVLRRRSGQALRRCSGQAWTAAVAALWVAALCSSLVRAATSGDGEPAAPRCLSETGLYKAGSANVVDEHNRPFSPQYPLWTDGAAKSRWIYLPEGGSIDTTDPDRWVFPVGTRFWKEFRFQGRKVETRMIWRASPSKWVFASYQWNDAQTDATLVPADGLPGAAEVAPGRSHSIPGVADCAACHGSKQPGPLGFNALQLSDDRDPNAIHGEPLQPGMLTLARLNDARLLSPERHDLVTAPPRIHTGDPETRAILGYFSANCGHCHNRSGEIGADPPSLHYADLMGDGDAVVSRLSAYQTLWQIPGRAEGASVMLDRARPDLSAMLARMRSRRPSSQMPPLGTVLRDDDAIRAIERWMAAAGTRH
jgi:cytochrome c553